MTKIVVVLLAGAAFCRMGAAQNQALSLTPPGPPFDYVLISNPASLVPATGITIEAWVYPVLGSVTPTSTYAILGRDDGGNSIYSFRLYLNAVNPAFHFRTAAGVQGILATDAISFNQWTHLAATYDNSHARLYKNGLLIGEALGSGPLVDVGGPYFAIGTPGLWNGQLDEVRIWSRARSPEQIQEGISYQLEDRHGLLASWHFDGDYLDSTGDHHGTPVGSPLFVPGTAPLLPSLSAPLQVSPGGQIVYRVSAVSAPVAYLLELSVDGTSPGIALPPPLTGVFPLNPPLLYATLVSAYPGLFHDFVGLTGPGGAAFPTLDVPAEPSLAGTPISAAFVTLDAAGPYGVGTVSNAVTTGIAAPAPQVSLVTPATAPTEGGTTVTITGANFLEGALVYFGPLQGGIIDVSPTTIHCLVPQGNLGPTSVTVVNPELSETVATGLFAYVETLVITGVAPQFGPTGSSVVLSGVGFQQGLSVTIDGIVAMVLSVTPTTATFIRPPNVGCNSGLAVTNPDGQTKLIVFNASAGVTDVVPGFGVVTGGNPVFLIGTGFVPGCTVSVGGQPATVAGVSPASVLFIAPSGLPGIASVVVTLPSGCQSAAEYTYQ